jgi:hypothetical protein
VKEGDRFLSFHFAGEKSVIGLRMTQQAIAPGTASPE